MDVHAVSFKTLSGLKSWIRRAAELLSRKVVLKRKLPDRFGKRRILVTPDSRLGFWRRDLEAVDPALFTWADRFVHRGSTVWDVGANVGVFTFASAVRAGSKGQVVAIEPDLRMAGLLQRSVGLEAKSEEAPVTVLPVAASDAEELVTFRIAGRGRASNYVAKFLGSTQTGSYREEVTALAISLDWLNERLPSPNLLKIDVEGGELAVLEGARKLIADHKPTIIAEVYERNRSQVAEILGEQGYSFYDTGDDHGVSLDYPVSDTLCVPPGAEVDW